MTAPLYQFVDITPKGMSGFARDINSQGAVLAIVERGDQIQFGIVWHRGAVLELPPVDGNSLEVRAINDFGLVVGSLEIDDKERAWRWVNGEIEFLAAKGDNCATDVNNHNTIVGYQSGLESKRSVMWYGDPIRFSEFRPDFVPRACSGTVHAFAINDQDVVAGVVGPGTYAFIKEQNSYRRIDTQMTDAAVWPSRINNHNMVVGHAIEPDEEFPFLYTAILERLPTIAGSKGQAVDINDAGVIVGASSYQRGTTDLHGTVWHQKKAYDLNDIVANIGAYTINYASAVNNTGQIAADAHLHGEDRILLLTPDT